MIRIAISVVAYEAICATLPLGSAAVEAEANERGERSVWLEAANGESARRDAQTGPATGTSSCGWLER